MRNILSTPLDRSRESFGVVVKYTLTVALWSTSLAGGLSKAPCDFGRATRIWSASGEGDDLLLHSDFRLSDRLGEKILKLITNLAPSLIERGLVMRSVVCNSRTTISQKCDAVPKRA